MAFGCSSFLLGSAWISTEPLFTHTVCCTTTEINEDMLLALFPKLKLFLSWSWTLCVLPFSCTFIKVLFACVHIHFNVLVFSSLLLLQHFPVWTDFKSSKSRIWWNFMGLKLTMTLNIKKLSNKLFEILNVLVFLVRRHKSWTQLGLKFRTNNGWAWLRFVLIARN